jgi:hypothetical protein
MIDKMIDKKNRNPEMPTRSPPSGGEGSVHGAPLEADHRHRAPWRGHRHRGADRRLRSDCFHRGERLAPEVLP